MRKSTLLGASCVLLLAQAAHAQTTTDTSHNDGVVGLPEIIVTSAKVETTLQRTPGAVSSISGDDLANAGITRAQDLSKLVPGLQVEQNGSGSSSIFIRGVGARVLSPSSDPAIAFSVDGVYYSRTAGPSQSLFDLARVEVVKGPQGTLYGRNATGGAVNVVTNRPKLGQAGGEASVEIGDYSALRLSGAVNIPLGEKAALRLAGQTVSHDGYLSDGYNDEDSKALRAGLLFQPTDDLEIRLSFDWANQGGQGGGPVPVGPRTAGVLGSRFVVANDPYVGPSDPRVVGFLNSVSPPSAITTPLPGVYCVGSAFGGAPNTAGSPAILLCGNPLGLAAPNDQGYVDNDYYGANLTVVKDFGRATLTGVGGYRGTNVKSAYYVDKGLQFFSTDVDQFSGELRLASNPGDSRLTWIAGAFYLREDQAALSRISSNNSAVSNPVPTPGSGLPGTTCAFPLPGSTTLCAVQAKILQDYFTVSEPKLINETYALFGQTTYSLTDRLRLTGGLRFTKEKKTRTAGKITYYYSAPAGLVSSYPSQGSAKYDDTSYRIGVEFDLAERSLLYANYSTAFHAGGFNIGVETGPNTYLYKPEKVKASVVGVKNRFFDNRLQLNIEAFYLDYQDYQTQRLGRVNDGSTACSTLGILTSCPLTLRTENAATVRIKGVETDIVLAVGENGQFNANALYNDGKFIDFKQANAFTGAVTDYSGRRLAGATKWTISAGYEQRFPLATGATIAAAVNTQYRSDTWMWYTREPGNFQPAFFRTDLNLAYVAPSSAWTVMAFVRNVEDKATLLQGSPADANAGVPYNILNSPRTIGASLSVKF